MKAAILTMGFMATADAHAHLTRVSTASGEVATGANHQPQYKDKIRHGIARNSGSGIPGEPSTFECDWCALEGTNKNPQRYSQWWSAFPGAYTTNPNTWPVVPCMSNDAYGARGVLQVRPGEGITTSTYTNADHGGFYRFELSYNTNPSNEDFFRNPVSDYYTISASNETPGFTYPERRVGPGDAALQDYIQKMKCVGVSCTGTNIRNSTLSETWTFPSDVPEGPAVMRWMWSSLETAEIYATCVDINIVGGPLPPTSPPTLPPTRPPTNQCANRFEPCGPSTACCANSGVCQSNNICQ